MHHPSFGMWHDFNKYLRLIDVVKWIRPNQHLMGKRLLFVEQEKILYLFVMSRYHEHCSLKSHEMFDVSMIMFESQPQNL